MGFHNVDEIREKYQSRIGLREKNKFLYDTLRKKSRLEVYFPAVFRNMGREEFIAEAQKYMTLKNLKKKDYELYLFLCRQNLLTQVFEAEFNKVKTATNKELLEWSKQYPNRTKCREDQKFLYSEIGRRGLIEKAFPKFYYTVRSSIKIAVNFTTRKELWRVNRGVYDWLSLKRKCWGKIGEDERIWVREYLKLESEPSKTAILLEIVIPEVISQKTFTFTPESAIEFASTFSSRNELKHTIGGGRACYDYLRKNKLLDKAFPKDKIVTIRQLTYLLNNATREDL